MDEREVDKIMKKFGKSGTLRSAVLKVEMALLDKLLFQPKNPKLNRHNNFCWLLIGKLKLRCY